MSGPENNPRDDEPIDRKEYEKWEAQQKGENMPTFEKWPECQEFYNLMQTYRHMPRVSVKEIPVAYEAVKAWLRSNLPTGPPAASEERGLREALEKHEYTNGSCLCGEFKLPPYGLKELEEFRPYHNWRADIRWHYWLGHFVQALQSAPSSIEDAINPCVDPEFVRTMPGPEPSSPLCPREDCPVRLVGTRKPSQAETEYGKSLAAEPSDAGQALSCGHDKKFWLDFGESEHKPTGIKLPDTWACAMCLLLAPLALGKLRCGGTLGLDGDTERDWATDGPAWEKRGMAAEAALEKLRELETTWIARSEMTPSCRNCSLEQCAYEMCADELHDVLTELEPKAPPPRTGQEEQD